MDNSVPANVIHPIFDHGLLWVVECLLVVCIKKAIFESRCAPLDAVDVARGFNRRGSSAVFMLSLYHSQVGRCVRCTCPQVALGLPCSFGVSDGNSRDQENQILHILNIIDILNL